MSATDHIIIQESGYLGVFTYNDAQTPVFFDNIELRHTSGPILEENHYYPFGMLMDMSYMPVSVNERNYYKFSRKELQEITGWGDHGARMSDYTIGRWWVPDPLAEKYYHISSYAFCGNNPVRFIDPLGLTHYSLDSVGNIIAMYDDGGYIMGEKDDFDMLFAGKNSIRINDKSILTELKNSRKDTNGESLHYTSSENAQDMLNLFVFAADNTTIEWSLHGYSNGKKADYVLGRLDCENNYKLAPNPSNFGRNELDLAFDMHSHPSVSGTKGASGDHRDIGGGYDGDMSYITKRYYRYQEANKVLPNHYVYHRQSKTLYQYTPWINSVPVKRISSGKSLYFSPFKK